ncbi:hypothetical protein [Aquitalea aquatica]|uniref:Uncharacterized protein n=1 Tax=Aquitalea aquatica TaxID=3044273 RepID=A0A838Y3U1_9NEIS|nr:hypothetical protein [Aquitalea magnusonii]MBA4708558.1 hypothetical protein [Aquitalea magnusonii]
MNKKSLFVIFLALFYVNSTSLAESITLKNKQQVSKTSSNLYRNIKFSKDDGAIYIDLFLARSRDGYETDSMQICVSAEKCAKDDWTLIGRADYFNSSLYSEVNTTKLDGNNIYTAFNLCQISNAGGEVSMGGQCLTITGQNENKKFVYNSYLGRASKCRPDSMCWQKLAKERFSFISRFLKEYKIKIFEQSK